MHPTLRILLLLLGLGGVQADGASIHVLAAASLKDSLKDIARAYEMKSGHKVVFNLGASSLLARQIEEAAPADIFFSADEANMDSLDRKALVVKETRRSRLSNALVVVMADDRASPMASAHELTNASIKRIALAETRTVPAGIYARTFLENAGLWNALKSKVVATDNVRAALSAVEAGNADAGIVYRTDAQISRRVKVVHLIPPDQTPRISYSMALVKGSRVPAAARDFLDYLESDAACRIFEQHGFVVRAHGSK